MGIEKELEKISKLGGETSSSDHTPLETYQQLHSRRSTYKGGACLTHCEGMYVQRNSCSYRWQAVHRAKDEDKKIYDEEFKMRTTGYVSSRVIEERMARRSVAPWANDHGAWEILIEEVERTEILGEEKHKYKTWVVRVKVIGEPFRTFFSPWRNNAHHILPVSTLLDVVGSISSRKPEVAKAILQDLLQNKYNINHFVNMMILPMDAKVSYRIGLPTHCGGHQKYSKKVKAKIQKILDPYAIWAKDTCKPPPEGKDIVEKLKQFSQDLHDGIVDAAGVFREKHKRQIKKNGDGKSGSIRAMSINSRFFCNIVANIVV